MKTGMLRLGISLAESLGMVLLALQFSPITTRAAVPAPPLAYPFTLEWKGSPDASVMGYAVYYGLEEAPVTNRVDAGANISLALMNLQAFSDYFFYVVSYDSGGVESPPSNILNYAPPALSDLGANVSPDGVVVIQFQAATNALCHLEFSPTLSPAQWQSLTSVRANSNGQVTVTDALPVGVKARYYRAVEP